MYDDFENRKFHGIHKSRYVASFRNVGGYPGHFRSWLEQLEINGERLTEDEIRELIFFAENGKMELEHNADAYLQRTFGKES